MLQRITAFPHYSVSVTVRLPRFFRRRLFLAEVERLLHGLRQLLSQRLGQVQEREYAAQQGRAAQHDERQPLIDVPEQNDLFGRIMNA